MRRRCANVLSRQHAGYAGPRHLSLVLLDKLDISTITPLMRDALSLLLLHGIPPRLTTSKAGLWVDGGRLAFEDIEEGPGGDDEDAGVLAEAQQMGVPGNDIASADHRRAREARTASSSP